MTAYGDVQESWVVLVFQHLFNCQAKQNKSIYANVYRDTIKDDDSHMSLYLIFSLGRRASIYLQVEVIFKTITL